MVIPSLISPETWKHSDFPAPVGSKAIQSSPCTKVSMISA